MCRLSVSFIYLSTNTLHRSQAHSEWRYYQASRATSPKRWVCTCGAGTEKPLKSSRAFTDHALSNECTDLAKHLELKSLHDKGINGVPPDGRPERKVRTATTVPANANVEALPAAPAPPREPSWHDLSNTDFETTGEVLLSIVEDIAASLPQDEMYTDGGSSFEHIQAYFDTALTLYEDSLDAPVFPTVD
ncbi:hypothetical protein BJ165DRAFT_627762 [Panaeolus papilionaceus]|nr:hypothetical protein BJ165DRAFT_627762 [Panaeolus papilionaceus]